MPRGSLLLSLLFFLVLAIAGPGAALADDGGDSERFLELFTELSSQLSAAGSDCNAVAAAIEGWGTRNGEELRQLTILMEKHFAEMSEEEMALYEKRFKTFTESLIGAATRCASHEPTQKAFEGLNTALGGE